MNSTRTLPALHSSGLKPQPAGMILFILGCLILNSTFLLAKEKEDHSDKDKRRLFTTWFLDGEKATWVISLRGDRSYDLIGPEGRRTSGKYNASDEALAFKSPAKGFLRHFKYRFVSGSMRLTPTKKDQPSPGDLLGEFPPLNKDQGSNTKYISLKLWQSMGKPTAIIEQKEQILKPVNSTASTIISKKRTIPRTISGRYAFKDLQNQTFQLTLKADHTFEFISPNNKKTSGTYLYINGELTLDSGFHRRHLAVTSDERGIQFARRISDVLKMDDPLGQMPPQGQLPLLWQFSNETATTRSASPTDKPITPTTTKPNLKPAKEDLQPLPTIPDPAAQDATPDKSNRKPGTPANDPQEKPVVAAQTQPPSTKVTASPPENTKPEKKTEPITQPQKTPNEKTSPDAPTPAASLANCAGTYQYKPNPLVTETLLIKKDGLFEYADSNGAKASGTCILNYGVMTLQSKTVIRTFTVALTAEKNIKLTRAANDNPKIANDLATMSPSVLKNALYERK